MRTLPSGRVKSLVFTKPAAQGFGRPACLGAFGRGVGAFHRNEGAAHAHKRQAVFTQNRQRGDGPRHRDIIPFAPGFAGGFLGAFPGEFNVGKAERPADPAQELNPLAGRFQQVSARSGL